MDSASDSPRVDVGKGGAGVQGAQGRSLVVDDQLNVPLEDAELLAEVELTTNLIIAATESEASLSQAQVDQLLGLDDAETRAPIPAQPRRP
jgi:hypothetical protein